MALLLPHLAGWRSLSILTDVSALEARLAAYGAPNLESLMVPLALLPHTMHTLELSFLSAATQPSLPELARLLAA